MKFPKLSRVALIAILTTFSTPIIQSLILPTPPVIAKPNPQRTELESLWRQAQQQLDRGQPKKAIAFLQQALEVAQKTGDRQAQARTLLDMGKAYQNLKQYQQALNYGQKSLSIAQAIKDRQIVAKASHNIGFAYLNLDNYTQATQALEQAVVVAREIKNRRLEGYSLFKLSTTYYVQKNYTKALEYSQQSLKIARELKERVFEAQSLEQVGLSHFNLENYPQAIDNLKQELAIVQKIDRKWQAGILSLLGETYWQSGDNTNAIIYTEESLKIVRETKLSSLEKNVLVNLGWFYITSNPTKSVEYSQQALKIAEELTDRRMKAVVWLNLSGAYAGLGNYAKVIEYAEKSLPIAKEIKALDIQSGVLINLGAAYIQFSDNAKAISYLQEALAIAKETKERRTQALALTNLGLAYLTTGDYAKAKVYQDESLAIAQAITNPQAQAYALNALGAVNVSIGNYPQAIEALQQSLPIARRIKDRKIEQFALNNLGFAYANIGNSDRAIEYLEQALTISREIKDVQFEGTVLGNRAVAYLYADKYKEAIFDSQQRLTIARQLGDRAGEAQGLLNLGTGYFGLNDYPKAKEHLKQSQAIAKKIQNPSIEGISTINLGSIYLYENKYPQAIENYQRGLAIAQEIKDRLNEGIVLSNWGYALLKSGKLADAETKLRAAISVRESLRFGLSDTDKVSILDTQSNTYALLQQVLVGQKQPTQALETSERGRTRAFVDLLQAKFSSKLLTVLKLNLPTIEKIKQVAKDQKATLVQYSIVYADDENNKQVTRRESELYVWVIKPTGEVTFRSVDLKPLWKQNNSLQDLVDDSRSSIGVFRGRGNNPAIPRVSTAKQNQKLQQLYQLLIQPIADQLPTDPRDRIVFIPQGSLFLAPFPALQDAQGKYLIEQHTILTAPSIQVLALTHQQRAKVQQAALKEIVVVGNPSPMPKVGEPLENLDNLPGAEEEAKEIAQLLDTKAILGTQATETATIAQFAKARIIHLATHGIFDDQQGLSSAIALAPTKTDDGLLTAAEILDKLNLNAELVVLSACDTGRGKITGDGVIGLSRSLISAGVPSVLVSLWAVPDAPTATLMTHFYQKLTPNADKAQVLRQAMLSTMKQHPDPRDWAAFTLIGEAQ